MDRASSLKHICVEHRLGLRNIFLSIICFTSTGKLIHFFRKLHIRMFLSAVIILLSRHVYLAKFHFLIAEKSRRHRAMFGEISLLRSLLSCTEFNVFLVLNVDILQVIDGVVVELHQTLDQAPDSNDLDFANFNLCARYGVVLSPDFTRVHRIQ